MSKSSVRTIRPTAEHSLDDVVSVTPTGVLQAQSIARLARATQGDDQPEVNYALRPAELLLDRCWYRLDSCQACDATVAS